MKKEARQTLNHWIMVEEVDYEETDTDHNEVIPENPQSEWEHINLVNTVEALNQWHAFIHVV